jgi:serine/threonine protein kinase/formylglycine-generating enzyme required for sulfatase activity
MHDEPALTSALPVEPPSDSLDATTDGDVRPDTFGSFAIGGDTQSVERSASIATGRYLLGSEIARGGMGAVYRATDTVFGREVAIKVLLNTYAPDSRTAHRFQDEARITGQLQHPGIPPVHDLGALPDGRPFLAMKLIKGDTLHDHLKQRSDPAADRGRLVAVFEGVCQAMAYAHAHGVVHRDLKPSNVMVGAFGEVQVMDWGLAKVLGDDRPSPADYPDATAARTVVRSARDSDDLLTQAGSVLGTPAYMPPEQAIGAVQEVDRRSDVFGLGAILAVVLTGRPPFVGDTAESTRVMAARGEVRECFELLDGCEADPELVALTKRCLAPRREDRPADAGAVAAAVAALRNAADERARQAELDRVKAEGDKVVAELRVEGERQNAKEQRKRRRVQLALAGFVLLVVVGGGLAVVQVQHQREKDRIAGEKQLDEATRQKERETRAASLVESLGGAETPSLPRIIADLADLRDLARPKLDEMRASAKPRQKLHASLALLLVDHGQVAYLHGRLLDAEPHQVPVIRDALTPHKDELRDKLWSVVDKPEKGKEPQRLRAAAALAKYDPESEKWAKASGRVVEQLVVENPMFLGLWMEGFRPIKDSLTPSLASIYRDANRRESERSLATNILADYAADQPPILADLLMDADEKQFAVIFPKYKEQGDMGLPLLIGEIDKTLPPDLPSSDDKRETLAKRQANAAVALLRLDQPANVWPLLKHSPDPRVRSYLIHRLSPLGADARAVVKHLDEETDLSIRRALLLSLGEFPETDFTPDDWKAVLPKVQTLYRTASDPGLHAASGWLLQQWKQKAWLTQVNEEWAKDGEGRDKRIAGIKELVTKDKEKTPPQWYVNTQGQTMVVIPGPVEFVMGSPANEADRIDNETRHRKRLGRTFALAATSVTKEQFLRFRPTFTPSDMKRYPEPDCPIGGVVWFDTAAYCNWLSQEEGISENHWCYEIKGEVTKLKENYLSLSGYRLPTEAEMEYATRAGALTSRHFGETIDLLGKYAWYFGNSQEKTWPVASLKPNDLGLFDVQGNVYTWCQESYKPYPQAVETSDDREDDLVIDSKKSRVLRGGGFMNQPPVLRSSNRTYNAPTNVYVNLGFRVVRTVVP